MHGQPLIYLDSAATTQKPRCVIDAVTDFYQKEYGTVHRTVYELSTVATQKYEEARETVRFFLNAAAASEIIFTRGTTDAINLVAASFGRRFLQAGDEVLISEIEHHSNIVPWQLICQERGARLRVAPVDDRGVLLLDSFEQLLSERTKLVSIAHIANSIGTLHPLKEIIRVAHAKGAKVLIDGAQSAGHLPVDVQELDADFFAFSGHKVFGPTGVGVLYGKRALLEEMPPYQGGGDMVDRVSFSGTTFQQPPLKFEAGTPMIAEVIGLAEALKFILSLGREKIAAWEHALLERATQKLQEIPGLRLIGTAPQKGAILSFVLEGIHPLDIGTLLDLRGVAVRTGHHCAQPTMQRFGVPATVRASFAPYNTPEEIDQFAHLLSETRKRLA